MAFADTSFFSKEDTITLNNFIEEYKQTKTITEDMRVFAAHITKTYDDETVLDAHRWCYEHLMALAS